MADSNGPVGMVLTVDQRGSRTAPDRVTDLLEALAPLPSRLAFSRTAGDEVQGLVCDPGHLPALLEVLLRDGGWRVGLGIGHVEAPLPGDVREARGPAFVHARDAVEAARHSPAGLRVVAGGTDAEQRAGCALCGCGPPCSSGVPIAGGRSSTSSTPATPTTGRHAVSASRRAPSASAPGPPGSSRAAVPGSSSPTSPGSP